MFEVHCDVRDGHWASLPELRGEPLIPALPGVQSCRLLQVEFKGPFILNGRLVFSGARRVDSRVQEYRGTQDGQKAQFEGLCVGGTRVPCLFSSGNWPCVPVSTDTLKTSTASPREGAFLPHAQQEGPFLWSSLRSPGPWKLLVGPCSHISCGTMCWPLAFLPVDDMQQFCSLGM